MRQRHTTERQQKLRSLQKKRLERTASKMALLQSGSDSESAARSAQSAPAMKPATRLSAAISASNLTPGLPPHPSMATTHVAAAPLPPAPPQQQQQQQQPQQYTVEQFATQAAAEMHAAPMVSQVAQLQTEDLTMSRTSSQRSLGSAGSDSKLFCDDGSDLPIEEQQKIAKEKKRIEALAKMQMMEQTSLLSLDSKPKERKGSMISLCAQTKKADSADESEAQ